MRGASGIAPQRSHGPGEARRAGASAVAALALFAVVDLAHFLPVLRAGPSEAVLSIRDPRGYTGLIASDHDVVVWEVYRNARSLLRSPHRFFDAEHCHPTPRSLALGEPMLAMSVLAIPGYLLGADPVRVYNGAFFALPLLAALALFLLVREWTGSPVAATVAGLLFGFHPARHVDPIHPYAYDTSWVVFAIFFAQRWLRSGRWRDALAFAATASLQLGASFYAMVSAALVALPLGAALLWREGLGRARPVQLAAVVALVAAFAAWLFAPYLVLRSQGTLSARSFQAFAASAWYLPGGKLFPGFACIALSLAAFAVPARRGSAPAAAPRFALALGGLLAALVAGGPGWRALAALLPGFETVRAPETVSRGLHLAMSALAGIGCARLLAVVPPGALRPTSLLLVLAVAAEILWTGALGPPAVQRFAAKRVAPDPSDVAFYAELGRQGNAGPILDVPLPRTQRHVYWPATSPWILLSAYHGRPTSACLSSYLPDARRLEALATRLPDPEALRELAALGFTTVVYHHHLAEFPQDGPPGRRARVERALRRYERESSREGGALRPLRAGPRLSAWAIRAP